MSAGQRRRLSNPESQAQYLYEARGEAKAALDAYNSLNDASGQNVAMQHNLTLLTYLAGTHKTNEQAYLTQAYLTALKGLHSRIDRDYEDDSDLALQQLVLSYNLALHSYFSREFEVAEKIIYPIFEIIQNKEEGYKDMYHGHIKCKIAFLLVDCMLEVYDVEIVKEILDWVEKYITAQSESSMDETSVIDCHPSFTEESDSELKFRLHCYRARFLFISAERDKTILDVSTKKARKELKNAMEIFNHKLSSKKSNADSTCDGGSVQDSVAISVDSGIGNGNGINNDRHRLNNNNVTVMIGNGHDINDDNRSPFERKKSDTQYQHALYLKARLEYLKGNTKKSLKLCSEAQNTATRNHGDEMTSIHHAIYNSNVAIVHQTSGQYFLAMHYYAHALEHIEIARKESNWIKEDGTNACGDGTMNQISVKQVLYNAAICAQKCGNYASSCECMLRYLELSDVSATHPFPWLHLAESCIGIHAAKKRGDSTWVKPGSNGKEELDSALSDPLTKAVTYLTRCMALCLTYQYMPTFYEQLLESARVSLAFVWLEISNYASVVHLADLVLGKDLPEEDGEKAGSQRLRATVRIYACEAMSLMGNPQGGLKYLPDDLDDVVDFMVDTNKPRRELKEAMVASVSHVKQLMCSLEKAH